MNPRLGVMLGLIVCSSYVFAADPKENLERSRSTYQQAVTQHGAHSTEARSARQNLRAARRTFHNDRRQRTRHQGPR